VIADGDMLAADAVAVGAAIAVDKVAHDDGLAVDEVGVAVAVVVDAIVGAASAATRRATSASGRDRITFPILAARRVGS
jgi:hypothetical protein